jgi:hypothetical protein
MTDERLPLAELLQKAGDGDFLRSVAEAVLQLLMEADVEGVIGAARHERTRSARPTATATATAPSTPGSARSSCASRSCGPARPTSRRSWSRGRPRRRRWWP